MLNPILSTITPDELKTAILTWAAVVTVVAPVLIAAVVKLATDLAAAKAQIVSLFELHGQNSSALTTLALHTPPPPSTIPTDNAALAANTAATQANTEAIADAPPAGFVPPLKTPANSPAQ